MSETDTENPERPSGGQTLATESGVFDQAPAMAGPQTTFPPGTRIGRFLVVSTLGQGGMGVVYQAYDPELDRRIALKVLSVNPHDPRLAALRRARLLREAQALAQLSHRNVVAVHDVGTYGDDVFIAMELLEGKDLRAWQAEAKPGLGELLRVFREAGQGLLAAHRKGIVHRDFKPDNLMIGEDGRVCVLDFGVARAAGLEKGAGTKDSLDEDEAWSRSAERLLVTPLTRVGATVGTIAYMSPEQHMNSDVDGRTDQFSYCVTLFEALTGERPFDGTTRLEIRKRVLKGELRDSTKEPAIPAWIGRILKRGLSTTPAERYPSMEELLRELENDPEATRQRQRTARLRTWFGVGVGLLLGGLLFGGSWLYSRTQVLCQGGEAKLAGVWDAPAKQRIGAVFGATRLGYAPETYGRLEKILDAYGAAWVKMHGEACAATRLRGEQSEQVLDLRMDCLAQRLRDLKAFTGVLQQADAGVVKNAIQAAYGLKPVSGCADAVALKDFSRRVEPPRDGETRRKVEAIREMISQAEALSDAGKLEQAYALAQAAAREARKAGWGPVLAEALYTEAYEAEAVGKYAQADEGLEQAWLLAHENRHDELAANCLNTRTWLVGYVEGRTDEGLRLSRLAEAAIKRVGDELYLWSSWHDNLGSIYWNKGDYQKGLEHHQKSLSISEKLHGPDHYFASVVLNNIGIMLWEMGRYDEAKEHYLRALRIGERVFGPNHPNLAMAYSNLGLVLLEQGEYEQARRYLNRDLELSQKTVGQEHATVADSLTSLGMVSYELGRLEEARGYAERALSMYDKTLGRENLRTAYPINELGRIAWSQGKLGQALTYHRTARNIWHKVAGPKHPYLAKALLGLGRVYLGLGRPREAIPVLEQAAGILEGVSRDPTELNDIRFALARALSSVDRGSARVRLLATRAKEAFAGLKQRKSAVLEVEAFLQRLGPPGGGAVPP